MHGRESRVPWWFRGQRNLRRDQSGNFDGRFVANAGKTFGEDRGRNELHGPSGVQRAWGVVKVGNLLNGDHGVFLGLCRHLKLDLFGHLDGTLFGKRVVRQRHFDKRNDRNNDEEMPIFIGNVVGD